MISACETCWKQFSGRGHLCGSCERDAREARSDPTWWQEKRRFTTESRAKPGRLHLSTEDRAELEDRELELERELLLIFDLADYDCNREITRDEWEDTFRKLDQNGDKKLSRKEWVLQIESTAMFDRIPKKYHSCLTYAEWCSAFKDFDSNGDGNISLQEWLAAQKSKFAHYLNDEVWDQGRAGRIVAERACMPDEEASKEYWLSTGGEATIGIADLDSRDWIIRWEGGKPEKVQLQNGRFLFLGTIYQLRPTSPMSCIWPDGTVQTLTSWDGRTLMWTTTNPDRRQIFWDLPSEDPDDRALPQQQGTIDAQLWHPKLVKVVPDAEPARTWSPRSTHHEVRLAHGDAPAHRVPAPRQSGSLFGKRSPRVREPEPVLISF